MGVTGGMPALPSTVTTASRSARASAVASACVVVPSRGHLPLAVVRPRQASASIPAAVGASVRVLLPPAHAAPGEARLSGRTGRSAAPGEARLRERGAPGEARLRRGYRLRGEAARIAMAPIPKTHRKRRLADGRFLPLRASAVRSRGLRTTTGAAGFLAITARHVGHLTKPRHGDAWTV